MLKSRRLIALLAIVVVAVGTGAVLLSSGSSTPQAATGSVHPSGWASTPPGFRLLAPAPSTVPTATMYDTITLATVPPRPFALAGYTSGIWPTFLPLRAAYPAAHTVSIAIRSSLHADCLDDEPGDATPAQAGPWAVADIQAGFAKPCVYGDLSEMPAIQASLRASLGSGWRARVFLWLAWYRFVPGLVGGYDAVQWTDKCLGRNLDCSTVSLAFLSIAHPPYVAPKPKPAPKPPAPQPKPVPKPAPKPNVQVCKTLTQRAGWFAGQLHQHPRVRTAYRQRALASTRRALKKQGCR